MNPSYLRMRRPLEDAMARYNAWIGGRALAAFPEVTDTEAIDLALENPVTPTHIALASLPWNWRGLAVLVYAVGPWTVFQEISGGLGGRPTEDWLQLADGGDLVFAGYNDAIGYGELVQIEHGQLVRHFRHDDQDPSAYADVGRLPEEVKENFSDWTDVAKWVDVDDERYARYRGLLWIHQVDG